MEIKRCDFKELGLLRPWLNGVGEAFVTLKDGREIRHDSSTSPVNRVMLTKDQWKKIDHAVHQAWTSRTKIIRLLMKSSQVFNPGMGVMCIEDRVFDSECNCNLVVTPLPFTHFSIDQSNFKETVMFEAGARRVGEMVEKTLLGVGELGELKLWGIFNHPASIKLKAELVLCSAENPKSNVHDVCFQMVEEANRNDFFGPFLFVHSGDLDSTLDNDGTADKTIRENIREIKKVSRIEVKIVDVVRADFLKERNQLALIQLTPDVVRIVNPLKLTVIQWENSFEVLTICVPQIRSNVVSKAGIVVLEKP